MYAAFLKMKRRKAVEVKCVSVLSSILSALFILTRLLSYRLPQRDLVGYWLVIAVPGYCIVKMEQIVVVVERTE
jgi:hypothetical protein